MLDAIRGLTMSGMVAAGALLWPLFYEPLAQLARRVPASTKKQILAIGLAALAAGIGASAPAMFGLALVCGVMAATDLLYRHLSLPLQALALLLALGRLTIHKEPFVHLWMGAALALIYLALAGLDRAAGLGDVAVMGVVGLVAGLAAPLIVILGTLAPLILVLSGRVGARDPQPLGGWWLAAMLVTAPWAA